MYPKAASQMMSEDYSQRISKIIDICLFTECNLAYCREVESQGYVDGTVKEDILHSYMRISLPCERSDADLTFNSNISTSLSSVHVYHKCMRQRRILRFDGVVVRISLCNSSKRSMLCSSRHVENVALTGNKVG